MSQWNATSTKVSAAIFVAGVAGLVLVSYATSDSSKPPVHRSHARSARTCPPLEPVPSDGSEEGHFYELDYLAKRALAAHHLDAAAALATELLALAPKYEDNWNYGNALHHGHTVLGQVALARGDVAEARRQLHASGATRGSPQLNSFGPSMALAQEMLERGEVAPVLQFLDSCARFWELGQNDLAEWRADLAMSRKPTFGYNACL